MKLTVLTHVNFEGPAGIGLWAEARGHGVEVVRLHRGERLPEVAGVGLLAVMGGPMNIYEQAEHPWLE
ncbi:MAG: amidotransferase, partial [Proteobacteria bacterium]|nr:amidotransferase [Pseudomonadota bacterium]